MAGSRKVEVFFVGGAALALVQTAAVLSSASLRTSGSSVALGAYALATLVCLLLGVQLARDPAARSKLPTLGASALSVAFTGISGLAAVLEPKAVPPAAYVFFALGVLGWLAALAQVVRVRPGA